MQALCACFPGEHNSLHAIRDTLRHNGNSERTDRIIRIVLRRIRMTLSHDDAFAKGLRYDLEA